MDYSLDKTLVVAYLSSSESRRINAIIAMISNKLRKYDHFRNKFVSEMMKYLVTKRKS